MRRCVCTVVEHPTHLLNYHGQAARDDVRQLLLFSYRALICLPPCLLLSFLAITFVLPDSVNRNTTSVCVYALVCLSFASREQSALQSNSWFILESVMCSTQFALAGFWLINCFSLLLFLTFDKRLTVCFRGSWLRLGLSLHIGSLKIHFSSRSSCR